MRLTIELPDGLETVLKEQAAANGIEAADYARNVLAEALATVGMGSPRKSAFGLIAAYGPGPSDEEIEESRREMFRCFGEEAEVRDAQQRP